MKIHLPSGWYGLTEKPVDQTGFAICSPNTLPVFPQESDQLQALGRHILNTQHCGMNLFFEEVNVDEYSPLHVSVNRKNERFCYKQKGLCYCWAYCRYHSNSFPVQALLHVNTPETADAEAPAVVAEDFLLGGSRGEGKCHVW